jgi:hypothetical protein
MPEVRPGNVEYVTATKAVLHGAPCTEVGFSGTAVKQVAAAAGTGLGSSLINTVQVGEKFAIIVKGRVYVPNSRNEGGAFAKGDVVYIIAASNLLTAVVGTNLKYGRVAEIAGERGVATGQMRVDLDAKDSF